MTDIVSGAHVGMAYVDGVEAHHLAFRGKNVDWQLWVQAGDQPLPLKYVITSKWVSGSPEYTLQTPTGTPRRRSTPTRFTFTPPADATSAELSRRSTTSANSASSGVRANDISFEAGTCFPPVGRTLSRRRSGLDRAHRLSCTPRRKRGSAARPRRPALPASRGARRAGRSGARPDMSRCCPADARARRSTGRRCGAAAESTTSPTAVNTWSSSSTSGDVSAPARQIKHIREEDSMSNGDKFRRDVLPIPAKATYRPHHL